MLIEPLHPTTTGGWFSPRELEVLERICAGDTTPQLAQVIGLAPATVRWYVSQLLHRTGCRTRAQLAAHAVRSGLVT